MPLPQEKILDYIKRTGTLVAQAEKQAKAQEVKTAAIDTLIPDVVESLITNNHIPANLRTKAAQQLKDPVKALEILASVAANKVDDKVASMGGPVKTASAKFTSLDSPFVGGYKSERESDKRFEEYFLNK